MGFSRSDGSCSRSGWTADVDERAPLPCPFGVSRKGGTSSRPLDNGGRGTPKASLKRGPGCKRAMEAKARRQSRAEVAGEGRRGRASAHANITLVGRKALRAGRARIIDVIRVSRSSAAHRPKGDVSRQEASEEHLVVRANGPRSHARRIRVEGTRSVAKARASRAARPVVLGSGRAHRKTRASRRDPDVPKDFSKEAPGVRARESPKLGRRRQTPLTRGPVITTRAIESGAPVCARADAAKHGAPLERSTVRGYTQLRSVCRSRGDESFACSPFGESRKDGAIARVGVLDAVTRREQARFSRKGSVHTRANDQPGSRGCCLDERSRISTTEGVPKRSLQDPNQVFEVIASDVEGQCLVSDGADHAKAGRCALHASTCASGRCSRE